MLVRFKTEKELEKTYGRNWRDMEPGWVSDMNPLFGENHCLSLRWGGWYLTENKEHSSWSIGLWMVKPCFNRTILNLC